MFFLTYLRRELRRRMRQAVVIALGLALGRRLGHHGGRRVGRGEQSAVRRAERAVRGGHRHHRHRERANGALLVVCPPTLLHGRSKRPPGGRRPAGNGPTLQIGPGGGAQICNDGHCVNAAGHTYDRLVPPYQEPISASTVAAVARLHDVTAATGVLTLIDSAITYPANPAGSPQLSTCTVDGVATGHTPVGPLGCRDHQLRSRLHRRRLPRGRRGGGLRVRGQQQPQGRLGHHHQAGPFTVIGLVTPAAGRQPARRVHPASPRPGAGDPHQEPAGAWPARSNTDLRRRRQRGRHCRRPARRSPGCCPRHRDQLGQPGQPGHRVAVQRRQAGQRPGQVAVGAGPDRRVRRGQPADHGRGGPPGAPSSARSRRWAGAAGGSSPRSSASR